MEIEEKVRQYGWANIRMIVLTFAYLSSFQLELSQRLLDLKLLHPIPLHSHLIPSFVTSGMNPSSSSSSLKTVMKSVGKAGSAVRALATGSSGHSGNSGSGSSSASHHSHNSPHHSQQQPNAGIVHGQVINAHKAAHDYITKMIAQVSGLKALLLDADTVRPHREAEQ